MFLAIVVSAQTELEVWVGSWICQDIPGEDQAYQLEAAFEAEYPDVDVKIVSVAWVGMLDKFILASQTGHLPDVMCTESFLGWTQLFASYGHFMDLTDLMMEIGEDTFFAGVLGGNIYNGRYYSIPYRNSTRALIYNKDMFVEAGLDPDDPPETWAELLEYAQKLTKDLDGDGIIDQYGFSYPVARFCTVAPEYLRAILRSYGADILNEDMTECIINSPAAIEAVTLWTDLVKKYNVVPAEIVSYDDNDDFRLFLTEKTAMGMVGPWVVETADLTYPDVNYGITTIPSNEPGVPGEFGLIHMAWMADDDTEHRDVVEDFIKFTMRPEIDAWLTDSTPAVRAAWEEEAFTRRYSPEALEAYKNQMDHTITSIMLIPAGPHIAREVNVTIQRIILGMDAETALNEAKVIIDELLAEGG